MQGLSPLPPRNRNNISIDQDRPAYKVIEKRGFFDETDTLWEKGSMIYWDGAPSLGFEPLNELAEDRMRAHLEALDEMGQKVAKEKGMGHASQVNAFEAKRRLADMDRNVVDDGHINIMRAENRHAKRAVSIDAAQNEQIPLMRAKRKTQPAHAKQEVAKSTFSMKDKDQ